MTIGKRTDGEIAYEISEIRKRRGIRRPPGNQTPEDWDYKMAVLYNSTDENIPCEKWLEHFL